LTSIKENMLAKAKGTLLFTDLSSLRGRVVTYYKDRSAEPDRGADSTPAHTDEFSGADDGQSTGPHSALGEAASLARAGRSSEARDRYWGSAKHWPGSPDALGQAGLGLYDLGDVDGAVQLLEKACALDSGDATLLTLAGTIAAQEHRPQGKHWLEQAVVLDPDRLESRFALAVVLERDNRPSEAEVHYRAALEINSGLAPACLGLGNALRNQGRLEEARAAYERAIELEPNFASAHNNLGGVLRELKRYAEAETAYCAATRCGIEHADAWYNLGIVRQRIGNAFQQAGQLSEALELYRGIIAALPGADPANIDLMGKLQGRVADVYIQGGEPEKAVAVCDEYLEQRPGDSSIVAIKAIALNEQGNIESVRRLLDMDHVIMPVRLSTPPGYSSMGDFNRALSEHVCKHPSLRYSPPQHATRYAMHSGELLTEPKGPMAALERQVMAAFDAYKGHLRDADPAHPLLSHCPAQVEARTWGVVMRSQGHQIAHVHPAAWAVACYYAKVPDFIQEAHNSRAGWIEFGRTPDEFHCSREMEVRAFPPEEGTVFFFPGYLYHRTIPFENDETRISIPFDFVPAGDLRSPTPLA
jgi:tetratricopeptide (TPR) repeat protein